MTERQDVERMERGLNDMIVKEQTDFINGFMDEIKTPMKVVPEVVFKEVVLPYLLGEKKATVDDDNIRKWVSLVGGTNEPAEVRNHKGELCFVVPGLYDTSVIDPGVKSRTNFAGVFMEADAEGTLHPNARKAAIMNGIHENLADRLTSSKTEHSWQKVFSYYGLTDTPAEPVEAATRDLPPAEDDFSFDDE